MKIGRRETVKLLAGGAVAGGAAPLLSACRGFVRADLSAGDSGQVSTPGLDAALLDILYHASLAPSGHNTQPWTVRVMGPRRLLIGTATERWLPAVDPANRELLLSIGSFLENLVVAAGHHGFRVEYRVIASSPTDQAVLEASLRPGNPVGYPLGRVRLRRTVRLPYLPRDLKGDDIRALSESLRDRILFVSRASAAGKYLEEGTIEANRIQAYRDAAEEELSRWIRWSDDDARKFRNGFTPEALEITGLAGWWVRHHYDRRSVMEKGFRDKSVDKVRKQLQSYGGWLVVTS